VPALQNKDIQVAVSQGIVTLKGAVEKRSHSLAAANAAKTVPGVIEVVNLIKVGRPVLIVTSSGMWSFTCILPLS
jgi:osmotically-inducible protein OsmY